MLIPNKQESVCRSTKFFVLPEGNSMIFSDFPMRWKEKDDLLFFFSLWVFPSVTCT